MANCVVAERHVVAVGDHGLIPLAHGQRDKVVRLAFQRCRDFGRHGGNHALQIERIHSSLTGHGIANPVCRLGDRGLPDHLRRTACNCWCRLRHALPFIHQGPLCRDVSTPSSLGATDGASHALCLVSVPRLRRSGWYRLDVWLALPVRLDPTGTASRFASCW